MSKSRTRRQISTSTRAVRQPAHYTVSVSDLSREQREALKKRAPVVGPYAIDPSIIRGIVADGPFAPENELVDDAMLILAEKRFRMGEYRQRVTAFAKKLEALNVDVQLPAVIEGLTTEHLTDIAFNYAFAYAQAGYLLGVAVGCEMAAAR